MRAHSAGYSSASRRATSFALPLIVRGFPMVWEVTGEALAIGVETSVSWCCRCFEWWEVAVGEAAALRRALALGVAMAAVALASPLLSGSRASAGGGPGGVLAPADGALFGAAVQPPATGDPYQPVRDLEAKLGRKLAIDHYYRTWTTAFPDGREQWDASEGRIPMISWGKVATGEINAGKHDDLIRKRAQGLRALGQPVL